MGLLVVCIHACMFVLGYGAVTGLDEISWKEDAIVKSNIE
jgi:hypothetical protein